ncbi:helix-turn-helix domain-containing protein [Sorangium sp. So ce295]|uniref:helix-turn-helix domain-containing protein n=1 Tax=Sorangium sp. So ce295 TaxID=3133295 RepID=UPI003F61B48C
MIEIAIPPLRHRTDDILPLAEHFLARAAAHAGKPIAGFSGAAAKRLLAHDWPGNVRELENAIERVAALCDGGRISPDDRPEGVRARRGAPDFLEVAADRLMTLDELQREYAQIVLRRVGGKKQRAAALLGVDRRTLQRWFDGGTDGDEGP